MGWTSVGRSRWRGAGAATTRALPLPSQRQATRWLDSTHLSSRYPMVWSAASTLAPSGKKLNSSVAAAAVLSPLVLLPPPAALPCRQRAGALMGNRQCHTGTCTARRPGASKVSGRELQRPHLLLAEVRLKQPPPHPRLPLCKRRGMYVMAWVSVAAHAGAWTADAAQASTACCTG